MTTMLTIESWGCVVLARPRSVWVRKWLELHLPNARWQAGAVVCDTLREAQQLEANLQHQWQHTDTGTDTLMGAKQ